MSLFLEGGIWATDHGLHHVPYSLFFPSSLYPYNYPPPQHCTTNQSVMDGRISILALATFQALMDGTKTKPRVLGKAEVWATFTAPPFLLPKYNRIDAR